MNLYARLYEIKKQKADNYFEVDHHEARKQQEILETRTLSPKDKRRINFVYPSQSRNLLSEATPAFPTSQSVLRLNMSRKQSIQERMNSTNVSMTDK